MTDPLVRLPSERRKSGSVTLYYAGCCCSCCCLHTVGSAVGVFVGLLMPASKHVPPAHAAQEEPPRLEPPVLPPTHPEGIYKARPTLTDSLPPTLPIDEDHPPARRQLVSLGEPFPAARTFLVALALVVTAQVMYSALVPSNGFGDSVLGLFVCFGPVYLLAAWVLTAMYSGAYSAVRQDDRQWAVVNRIFLFGLAGAIIGVVAMMALAPVLMMLR